jgi:hypothetical protein
VRIATLVISQNQAEHIPAMLQRLSNIDPHDRYWVLDRCTDNSENLLTSEPNVHINKIDEGWLAGRMRDIGLDMILPKDYDAVVFFDGDRVPNVDITIPLIETDFERGDCILYLADGDTRENPEWRRIRASCGVWVTSCGMAIRTITLKQIRSIPMMNDRCFHKNFDGSYGIEDNFLGILLYQNNWRIAASHAIRVSGIFPSYPWKRPTDEQQNKYGALCTLIGFNKNPAYDPINW